MPISLSISTKLVDKAKSQHGVYCPGAKSGWMIPSQGTKPKCMEEPFWFKHLNWGHQMRIPYLNWVKSPRPHSKAGRFLDLRGIIQYPSDSTRKTKKLQGLTQVPICWFMTESGVKCHFRCQLKDITTNSITTGISIWDAANGETSLSKDSSSVEKQIFEMALLWDSSVVKLHGCEVTQARQLEWRRPGKEASSLPLWCCSSAPVLQLQLDKESLGWKLKVHSTKREVKLTYTVNNFHSQPMIGLFLCKWGLQILTV